MAQTPTTTPPHHTRTGSFVRPESQVTGSSGCMCAVDTHVCVQLIRMYVCVQLIRMYVCSNDHVTNDHVTNDRVTNDHESTAHIHPYQLHTYIRINCTHTSVCVHACASLQDLVGLFFFLVCKTLQVFFFFSLQDLAGQWQ